LGLALLFLVAVLAFTGGVFRAMQEPAIQALIPNQVPREDLLNAITLNGATRHGSRFFGLLVAAPLMAVDSIGVQGVLVLSAAFQGLGALFILKTRTVSKGESQPEHGVMRSMVDGLVYIYSNRAIALFVLLVLFHCALVMSFESILPIFSRRELGAIDGSIFASFYHQGQVCESGTRLLLPEDQHDEFVAEMVRKLEALPMGDPLDPATKVGPLVSERQMRTVLDYIEIGTNEGATLACGGQRATDGDLANGYFVKPTIFTGVTNDMRIAQEEIFGPVLCVMAYDSEDEAIAIANDSIFGLGGGVWSEDIDRAKAVAARMRTGTVWINDWHLLSERMPFGGYKQSGIGREFGEEGLNEYTEVKALHVDDAKTRDKKPWYDMLVPREDHPKWIFEAKVRPLVERGAGLLVSVLPERLRRELGTMSGTAKDGLEELQGIQDFQNMLNPPAKGDAPAGEPGYNSRERNEMQRAIEGIGGSGEVSQ